MHPPAKLLALVALLACAAVLAAPAAAEPAPLRADFRACSDLPNVYINQVRVRSVSCKDAKPVMFRYTRLMNKRLQHDWDLKILGFHCDLTGKDYYGDSHRCIASGGRVISFRRGT